MSITLPATIANDAQVWQAFRYHSRTFSTAARLLPEPVQRPIATLYLFCRRVDSIADQRIREVGTDAALGELFTLKNNLDVTLAGHPPDRFLWQRLHEVDNTFSLNKEPLYELIEGAAWDLKERSIETQDDLIAYANLVGGSIGAMMLPFLLERRQDRDRAEPAARALGIAMQITNILRDVGEDHQLLGRCYLPQENLSTYGLQMDNLTTPLPASYARLLESLMTTAETLYDDGLSGIDILPWRMRTGIRAAARMYREIMNEVRALGYDNLNHRAVVPRWRKSALVLYDFYGHRKRWLTRKQALVTT
jgi:phytoene synthase